MTTETRAYPLACISAYCGKIKCPTACPHLPALQEFMRWREQTNAKQLDPVWSAAFWTGTHREPAANPAD